jgi:aryl-alcohol dehydrogenase-like predicted oxidoreductase
MTLRNFAVVVVRIFVTLMHCHSHQRFLLSFSHFGVVPVVCRGLNNLRPVPSSDPNWVSGTTEKYVGSWLKANPGIREKLVIATKVAGFIRASDSPSHRYDPPREGKMPARHDAESVLSACEGSLRRLQTSYIDLYQLHWPDRYVPLWGSRQYDPMQERLDAIPIKETAKALKQLLDGGKIRAYGLSNETTFGVCEWCRVADELEMPRPATIQNQFCLLERSFEAHLAEACAPSNYNVGLLPWSVLAGGVLSGKYLGNIGPDGQMLDSKLKKSRYGRYSSFQSRFMSPNSLDATEQYSVVAKQSGMSLATLAQAFCKSR